MSILNRFLESMASANIRASLVKIIMMNFCLLTCFFGYNARVSTWAAFGVTGS